MPIFLPRPRVSKSQLGVPLDPTHPLAHRLRLFLPFNEAGGGKLTNLVRADETFTVNNPSGWKPFAGDASRADLGLKFNGTSDLGASDKTFTGWTGDLTVAVLLHQSVVPSVTQVVAELSSNVNSVNDAWAIFLDGPPWSVVGLRRSNAGTYSSAEVAVTAPGLHLYTFVHKAGSTALGWQDGVIPHATGLNNTAHPGTWGGYTLNIGARVGPSLFFKEGLLGLWIWARALSQAEIIQHAAEPFGMLAQRRLWIVEAPASGGVSHALTGTSLGTGTQTGTLTEADRITGTSLGTGTQTGSIRVAKPLTATSLGTGTQTGTARATKPLIGTSLGTGTQTGTLRTTKSLAGTSLGTGTQTGTLRNAKLLASSSLGTGTQTGTVRRAVSLSGTSLGTGSQTASFAGTQVLSGTSLGTGTQTGTLRVAKPLSGSSLGTGSQTGAVTVSGATDLVGTSLGTGNQTGTFRVAKSLAGASLGTGAGHATMTRPVALAGVSLGTGFARGSLSVDGEVVASFVFAAPTRTATLTTPTRSLTLTGPSALRILTTPSGVRGDDV